MTGATTILRRAGGNLAAIVGPEIVSEQQRALRDTASKVHRLRVALLSAVLYDVEELVVEIDGVAVTLWTLYEEGRLDELATQILTIVDTAQLPRRRCRTCREAACLGCGGHESIPDLPARIGELLRDLASGGLS